MYKLLRLSFLLALFTLLQACSRFDTYSVTNYSPPVEQPKTAEELRAELLVQEENAPDEYLKVKGFSRRNFINQLVLEGSISNTATLASFKDPVLSVTWYSKTNTELETKEYRVFELIRAHRSKEFKLKTQAPDYVSTVSISVAEATPVE